MDSTKESLFVKKPMIDSFSLLKSCFFDSDFLDLEWKEASPTKSARIWQPWKSNRRSDDLAVAFSQLPCHTTLGIPLEGRGETWQPGTLLLSGRTEPGMELWVDTNTLPETNS